MASETRTPRTGRGAPSYDAVPTSAGRSRNMQAIRRADTKPEIRLRSALHALGFRYRKDFPIRIDGRLIRPDIVFTRRKVVVFVDGCFWHSCPEHGRAPGVNQEYWSPKLRRNAERDKVQTLLLEQECWTVIRIWEHVPLEDAVAKVQAALGEQQS
ncbi:very short patch repair endonuclease [Rhodococcus qingshengii]|uniref:very short patch repair endonuclease n=1 Tax=Rhodococcus qingshengii TaxID=334542 RepID=UPI0037C74FDB